MKGCKGINNSKWEQNCGKLHGHRSISFCLRHEHHKAGPWKDFNPKIRSKVWHLNNVSLQITISPAEGAVCGYIHLSWNFFVMYFISMKFKKYEIEKKKKRGKKGSEFNISFSFNFTASGCVIFIISESEICNAYIE